jgi:hypothetical protein
MHLEATIMKPSHPLGGHDQVTMKMNLEPMIEHDEWSTSRRSLGGPPGSETVFIGK